MICAGLAVAALMLSGCANGGAVADQKPSGAALATVRQIPERLAEAGSSRVSTAVRMASGGTRITIHGEGAFDYREHTGELRVMLPDDPGDGRSEPVTELFVPGALYMKNRGAGVPADKWVRVATAALPDGNLVTGGATDPITAAELLRGAHRAQDLGEVEIGGEILRRYRGVTDIAAAAEAAGERHCREQLSAAVHGFSDTAVPFELYLDAGGLLREVRHHFGFTGLREPEGGGPAGHGEAGGPRGDAGERPEREVIEVTSTTVLHDFGTPVELRMPAAGDIFSGAVTVAG
jgi:hypothetical protein